MIQINHPVSVLGLLAQTPSEYLMQVCRVEIEYEIKTTPTCLFGTQRGNNECTMRVGEANATYGFLAHFGRRPG